MRMRIGSAFVFSAAASAAVTHSHSTQLHFFVDVPKLLAFIKVTCVGSFCTLIT